MSATRPPRRPVTPIPLPQVLPPSAEEQAQDASIRSMLQELIVITKRRNLESAVVLAELALKGRLPKDLEEHFGELGRRYSALASAGGLRKSQLVRLATQDGADMPA